MVLLNIQYFKSVIHHKNTFDMHNLKTNFDKLFNITKLVFKDWIIFFFNNIQNKKYKLMG